MKKLVFLMSVICYSGFSLGQAYIPMPSDSNAMWRYRIYVDDDETSVTDFIFFTNGQDTSSLGNTYHKIMSRNCVQYRPIGARPPVVPMVANLQDVYAGAYREVGKKVYLLLIHSEQLLYDFNAVVGDSIPAFLGNTVVTGIDTVLLSGAYHKRYLTPDTAYYVIEGVGSSRGLIPSFNEPLGIVTFFCFAYDSVRFSPDTTVPCTYVYPFGFNEGVSAINERQEIKIFPVPANDILHISTSGQNPVHAVIYNCIGRALWNNTVTHEAEINVTEWPKGIYYLRSDGTGASFKVNKIVVE